MKQVLVRVLRRWRRRQLRRREDAAREMLGRVSRQAVALAARRARRERLRLEAMPVWSFELPPRGRSVLWREWR